MPPFAPPVRVRVFIALATVVAMVSLATLGRAEAGSESPVLVTGGVRTTLLAMPTTTTAPKPSVGTPPAVAARRSNVGSQTVATVPRATPAKPTDQLLFDGQSFNAAPFLGNTYPLQLLKLMGARVATSKMVAIAGTAYWQRSRTVTQRVDALIPNASRTTVLDLAGQSDILANLAGQQLFDAVAAYADGRRAAGAAFFVEFTINPSSQYSPAQDASRRQYNALLLADGGRHFSAVIDSASRPEFADPTNLRYFDDDGLHPTEAADTIFATLAQTTLARLLG